MIQNNTISQPQSGTSGISLEPLQKKSKKNDQKRITELESEDSEAIEIDETEKCIVCKEFTPKDIDKKPFLTIVTLACCDNCQGWVHLSFSTTERVIRRGGHIFVPVL